MANIESLIAGLLIVQKYAPNARVKGEATGEISIDLPLETISPEDRLQLEALEWTWDEEWETWNC